MDFSKLDVGTKVFSTSDGHGVIDVIGGSTYLPVYVKFNNNTCTYTRDGKHLPVNMYPSLFLSPQDAAEYFANVKEPLPDLPVDAPILVRKNSHAKWTRRHFKRWNDDGKPVCFVHGETSWTGSYTTVWDEWKLPEDK